MRLGNAVTRSLFMFFLRLRTQLYSKMYSDLLYPAQLNYNLKNSFERQRSGDPRENRNGTLLREIDFECF